MRAGSAEQDGIGRQAAAALERASVEGRLAALAVADPQACARALIDHAGLDAAQVGRALQLVAEGISSDSRELCRALALRWGPFCDPDVLARLLGSTSIENWCDSVASTLDRAIGRVPLHGALLRLRIALAARRREYTVLDGCLARLVLADPSWATLNFVARTRKQIPRSGERPTARVALLSSYTIDPLVVFLEHEIHGIGAWPDIYVAPFNTWEREVLDPSARLRSFEARVAILAVSLDDLVPDLSGALRGEDLNRAGESAVARVLEAAENFTAWSEATLVVHGFWSVFARASTPAEARLSPTRSEWVSGLNARLAEGLRAIPRAFFFDTSSHLIHHGGGQDAKLRHLAAMRLAPATLPSLARAMVGYVAPAMGLTRKCVVVDLDNTLWGGVVGEDGPGGIRLGNTAPGSEFVEFQRFLKSLSERGILLAVNSKNNLEDAIEVLRNHESMILRESDFSAMRINWNSKPENMREIAGELNIGLDSLVFVDDNPDERERMRQMLPEVLTVDLPSDPSGYRATLESLPQLQVLAITAEDRARVDAYRNEQERSAIRHKAASVEEYLASLEVMVEIRKVSDREIQRVTQLFQRTNQFNLTTRRFDLHDVRKLAADPAVELLALGARDRFGEHGLVAVAMVRIDAKDRVIDSLLMSCRVIGYGIETALLASIAEAADATGADRLIGEFIPSKKNTPARDFYARHGFVHIGTAEGVERWECKLPSEPLNTPPWISRKP